MNKKVIVTDNKALTDYRFCGVFNRNNKINEKKLISKEIVDKRKRGKYFKIDENYYIKLPLFKLKTAKILTASLVGLLVAGAAATVTVFYMPHKVTLNSDCLEISKSNKACLGYDYKCTFKIKDDKVADNYDKVIKISSIKSNGKVIPSTDYGFIYQTNAKNELTIDKKYLGGKIEINADLVKRDSGLKVFWFEFNIINYSDFKDLKVTVPRGDTKIERVSPDDSQEKYKEIFKKTLDFTNPLFDIVDNIIMFPEYDILMIGKGTYKFSETFSYSFPTDEIIVREDNAIRYDITAKSGMTLPKNLWLRSNARFTKKDEDFFLTFNSEYTKATMEIPYYFVKDNGSINMNPDAEVK